MMGAKFTAYLREILAYAMLVEGEVRIDPPSDDDDPRWFVSVHAGSRVMFDCSLDAAGHSLMHKGVKITTVTGLVRAINALHPYTERVYQTQHNVAET